MTDRNSPSKLIFGFDVGLGSLGEAVRRGGKIVHADSLLIDAEVATIQEQAEKRRQKRTRETHKMREKWWQHIWETIGKKPIRGIEVFKDENGEWDAKKGDERLEREFSKKKGDNIIYTSCLLRIKLLRGEELEDWQIYKAIRSAFVRAGCPPNVPWAKSEKGDEKENRESVKEFQEELENIFSNTKHHFSCYYDAYQMGLFDPKNEEIKTRQNHKANRARGYTASRGLVEKELRLLLEQAAKQIPELKNMPSKNWQEYILFGLSGTENLPNKSWKGFHDTKIQGILDQKKAQFDNRCVNHCSQIPRFKATRAENILYFQTHFLLKLCNMLVEKKKKMKNSLLRKEENGMRRQSQKEKNIWMIFLQKEGKKLLRMITKKLRIRVMSRKLCPRSEWVSHGFHTKVSDVYKKQECAVCTVRLQSAGSP